MNKYNVFTILNSSYIKFGKIWINSLYDKVDINKIENIFIGDTGLNKEDKNYLQKYDKVKIINTNISDTDTEFKTWGDKWHNSVSQKTKLFRELIKTQNLPVIMLDVDLLFLKDINSLINLNYDIQICFRNHKRRERPHPMDYLASYVCVNNKKALQFLDTWINMIDNSENIKINGELIEAKETPCLCKTVEIYRSDNIKIGHVDEDIVSVYDSPDILPDLSKIIHFKGLGGNSLSNSIDEAYYNKITAKGWDGYIIDKNYLN